MHRPPRCSAFCRAWAESQAGLTPTSCGKCGDGSIAAWAAWACREAAPAERSCRPVTGVDFWRVEEVAPGEEISLRAEMKLPGRAWLQFFLLAESRERTLLSCYAWFEPRGLAGELYWGLLYPIHVLIFRGMVRAIARKSEDSFRSQAEAFQGS